MAKESIMRIAQAETDAQAEEARAKAACDEIARDAQAQAQRIAEAAAGRCRALIAERVEQANAAASVIERDSANDARREAAALARGAENSHDRAVNLVLETLVRPGPA